MKKTTRKILSLALAVLTVISLFGLTACSNTGKTMMSMGNAKITENMYIFWLSRQKAQFEYAYGDAIKSAFGISSVDAFWDLKISQDSDVTYDQKFTEDVFENARTFLCALYLFDEFNLKLSDETQKSIDESITKLKDELCDGSKDEFNVLLANYGINMDTLKACYEINEKVNTLREYLFAEKGPEAITTSTLEAYYQKTYVRMEQICIFLDQCPEKDEEGNYVIDTDGSIKYRSLGAAEMEVQRAKAAEALAALNDGQDFTVVAAAYNENTESDKYTNGIYLTSDNVYNSGNDAITIYETLQEMNEGEYKLVELEHTLHIMKKLPLEVGAYNNSTNTDFFVFWDTSAQDYVQFEEYVKTPLFLEYITTKLAELEGKIKVDEEIKNKHTIKSVTANSTF